MLFGTHDKHVVSHQCVLDNVVLGILPAQKILDTFHIYKVSLLYDKGKLFQTRYWLKMFFDIQVGHVVFLPLRSSCHVFPLMKIQKSVM